MSKPDDGGPAFPWISSSPEKGFTLIGYGMSLRDYYAGQALAGCLAGVFIRVPDDPEEHTGELVSRHVALYAAAAYMIADDMLVARTTVPSDQPSP